MALLMVPTTHSLRRSQHQHQSKKKLQRLRPAPAKSHYAFNLNICLIRNPHPLCAVANYKAFPIALPARKSIISS